MEKLEKQIRAVVAHYHMIGAGERVLVGVSGGADSVCLLSALLTLREAMDFSLSVVHVNHGLRAAAVEEERFVARLAAECGVPFHLESVDVPALQKKWRCSIEDAARRARYEAFSRVIRKTGADRLAVAHNRDDQAETVLLKLFRGAGLRGFAGMAPVRAAGAFDEPDALPVPLIRPLLFTPRAEIETYLKQKGLSHVEDHSNASDAYARNRIRRHVIPCAKEQINVGAAEHLAGAAQRAREALDFIEEEAKRRYQALREQFPKTDVPEQGAALELPSLRREPTLMQKEILMAALREAGAARGISAAHIDALLRLTAAGDGTRMIDLPGGFRAVREYDTLRIARRDEASKVHVARHALSAAPSAPGERRVVPLPGAGRAEISVLERSFGASVGEIPADDCTKWFDYDKILESVVFRTRRAGDWIAVGSGRKSLKKEMIDLKIPENRRGGTWLLAAGDEILWIVGYRRCEGYKVTAQTSRILQVVLDGQGEPVRE